MIELAATRDVDSSNTRTISAPAAGGGEVSRAEVSIRDITRCPFSFADVVQCYAASWRSSHGFFPPERVAAFTGDAAASILTDLLAQGGRIWVADVDSMPAGIVALIGEEISKLYVHPDAQNLGIGSKLLAYASAHCHTPRLHVLSINLGAQRLYFRHGFRFTGNRRPFFERIMELEMIGPAHSGKVPLATIGH